jgi:hypothetical protein
MSDAATSDQVLSWLKRSHQIDYCRTWTGVCEVIRRFARSSLRKTAPSDAALLCILQAYLEWSFAALPGVSSDLLTLRIAIPMDPAQAATLARTRSHTALTDLIQRSLAVDRRRRRGGQHDVGPTSPAPPVRVEGAWARCEFVTAANSFTLRVHTQARLLHASLSSSQAASDWWANHVHQAVRAIVQDHAPRTISTPIAKASRLADACARLTRAAHNRALSGSSSVKAGPTSTAYWMRSQRCSHPTPQRGAFSAPRRILGSHLHQRRPQVILVDMHPSQVLEASPNYHVDHSALVARVCAAGRERALTRVSPRLCSKFSFVSDASPTLRYGSE